MGYSDDELGGMDGEWPSDIPIWNAGSVYFDDEIVEYQGKYYKALRKTSAEIPGRCKAGIWKALHSVDEANPYVHDDLYADDIAEIPAELVPDLAKELKADAPIAKATVQSTQEKIVQRPELLSPSQKVEVKPVNKPLMKKKTLKEQQEELRLRKAALNPNPSASTEPKAVEADMNIVAKPVPRKMTMAPSDQTVVNNILKEIDFSRIKGLNTDENTITSDLLLSQEGVSLDGGSVSWESSHPHIISAEGRVKAPQDGSDVAVNLSVTVSKNKTSATRFFTLWVKAEEVSYSDEECVDMVYEALDFDQIRGKNIKVSEITYDLELLTEGLYHTEIFWASKDRSLIDETGRCYQYNLSKNTKVRLYAIITKGNVERLKHFDLTLKTEDF